MYAPRVEDNTEFYRVDLTYVKKPTKFDYTKPEQELDFLRMSCMRLLIELQ